MDATPIRLAARSLLICCCLSGIACETLRAPGSTADWFARHGKGRDREVASHREQWQTRRDGMALKWLLATQVSNGMTVDEVDSKLGDTAEREEGTREFKQKVEGLRIDDVLFRYGPARDGEVFYLAFREGKLVNFDPKKFAAKM